MPPRDLTTTTADVLARLLRRLPPSLWDNSPASQTPQRDVYRGIAAQCAIWLQQRDIARTMTLLLEAEGADLDVLLQDYGLKRYLQRPDRYARQVGMHILWTPKATQYALANLADLLFDAAHVTLRTGPNQVHVFVAVTHPVTTPYSYWGMISADGIWYAVTVDGGVPTISQMPPPGLDVSPGPHTLSWFTVTDELDDLWYVSIAGDTLRLETTQPVGYGTTEPFAILDGHGTRWLLEARSGDQVLASVVDPGLPGFGTWSLRDAAGVVYALWIEGHVPTIATSAPGGSTDQTPGGVPVDWLQVPDQDGTPWYVSIEHAVLVVTATAPGGVGTTAPVELLDATGQRWVLTVQSGEAALVTTALAIVNANLPVVAPDASFQAFQLLDSAGVPWWLCIDVGTLFVTSAFPVGATDVTPPGGPYRWWRLYDLARTVWYAWPSTMGIFVIDTVSPGGHGTIQPQILGDTHGVLWHVGVDLSGTAAVSDRPPIDYGDLATAICLADETGHRWFWRVHGQVLEWSAVLWPDTADQSPWGSLGWLQVRNEVGALRYVGPTPLGDPMATAGAPTGSFWGWQEPVQWRDLTGANWHLTVLSDDRVGIAPEAADDIPLPTTAVPLREALEAFAHVQAAGSNLTLLIT